MNAHKIGDVLDGTVGFIIGDYATVELAPHLKAALYGKRAGPKQLKTPDGRVVSNGETVRVRIEKFAPYMVIFPITVSLV
jgi:hypothetical protein